MILNFRNYRLYCTNKPQAIGAILSCANFNNHREWGMSFNKELKRIYFWKYVLKNRQSSRRGFGIGMPNKLIGLYDRIDYGVA